MKNRFGTGEDIDLGLVEFTDDPGDPSPGGFDIVLDDGLGGSDGPVTVLASAPPPDEEPFFFEALLADFSGAPQNAAILAPTDAALGQAVVTNTDVPIRPRRAGRE